MNESISFKETWGRDPHGLYFDSLPRKASVSPTLDSTAPKNPLLWKLFEEILVNHGSSTYQTLLIKGTGISEPQLDKLLQMPAEEGRSIKDH